MAKKKVSKPFKDWLYEEINTHFGFTRVFEHPLFEEFDELPIAKNSDKHPQIEGLRKILTQYVDSWNEDEYKFMFISPFIALVEYHSPHYKVFTQRPMSLTYDNDTKLTEGIVEFMVAKGIQIPQKPHFFIHEYKPEKRRDNDPLGQLLIGMLAARTANKDGKPIYGIYVNGRNWHFVILEETTYATSRAFVATDVHDVFRLFAVLLYLKDLMEKLYAPVGDNSKSV